jgi:hypothetical protein
MMRAERFARLVERMGLVALTDRSSLSHSEYVEVIDQERGKHYKIRFADHETRPTYGRLRGYADFEVGEHQDGDGDWKAAIRWLAAQTGRKPVFAVRHKFSTRGAALTDRVIMYLRQCDLEGEEVVLRAWGCGSYNDFWQRYLAPQLPSTGAEEITAGAAA